ncbi:MAG: Txe/YoeB family addiction module toxin [Oscillospiraceae bacterium]|jgi:toxin YoeB|nr:Txe/YoeB family addiction module toxin [Oscillospiraceae bacterium]
MSKLIFTERAWEDYLFWQGMDKKTIKRINLLLKDISRNSHEGIGKPEPLRHRDGWSRRIDGENRLVYLIKENCIEILQCRGHYDD